MHHYSFRQGPLWENGDVPRNGRFDYHLATLAGPYIRLSQLFPQTEADHGYLLVNVPEGNAQGARYVNPNQGRRMIEDIRRLIELGVDASRIYAVCVYESEFFKFIIENI